MNKSFFVVFLGIILGAMVLIFLTQPTTSLNANGVASSDAGGVASSGTPGGTEQDGRDSGGGQPTAVATAPVAPRASSPDAAPEPAKPPVKPEPGPAEDPSRGAHRAAAPEPTRPVSAKPETSKPEPGKTMPGTPGVAKPEPAGSEPAGPETPKPMAAAPGTSKTEPVKPAPAAPVAPGAAKPEPARPQAASAEPGATTGPGAAMTPVTSTPRTPAKPESGGNARKSLTLANIGLHFKGSGMALRIEADAPFSYKTFALSSPDRYVVDLVGNWDKMRAPTVPSNNMIKGARVGKQPGGPRLVLDMQRAPKKHNVTWVSPTVLEILIE